ncbi:BTB/POZ domain-containing protein [Phanerochaete sordida]|uniref:BTB/POZ domain-containing protein n=1 Tax=Phanerochaete sordida TaxID=48140 RepID=A0A9P3L885_9APHY|nr:BTB/POZ domain-containing protein [Phanerochaete sordida]
MASHYSVAATPFDKPGANLVLRTADNVDFFVSKMIMALASPIFADMFHLAEPTSAHTHDTATTHAPEAPVIELTERSRALDHFLRFIYPIDKPHIDDPEHILDVLKVASKYMVDFVEHDMLQRFSALAEERPFHAYAQAYQHRREDAMRIAARASLAQPWPGVGQDLTIEFMEFPAALTRLQDYHSACGDAAAGATRAAGATTPDPVEKPWFPYTHTSEWRNRPEPRFYYTAHPWWKDALETLVKILRQTPHPRVTHSQRFFGILLTKAVQVGPGAKDALCSVLLSFMDDYRADVDKAVSEVTLAVVYD